MAKPGTLPFKPFTLRAGNRADRALFAEVLWSLDFAKNWVVGLPMIQRKVGITTQQRRFYRGVVCEEFAKALRQRDQKKLGGRAYYTEDDCHEMLLSMFSHEEGHIVTDSGKEIPTQDTLRTSEMTVGEMCQFLDDCIVFLWEEFRVDIPEDRVPRPKKENEE